jgi:glycosyltransferase involved in cell wall biosynthesis
VRLLCVASLTPRKGIPYLLTACQSLVKQGVDLELRLAGAGEPEHLAHLKQLTEGYGIASRVHCEGYVGDRARLLELYRNSDIFVLPSLHEGYPRVVDEAMSQSLPVVCTAVGGVPATLVDEQQALVVPPGNAPALAEAILRLCQEPALRRTLIQGGMARARAELSKELSPADQLLSLAKQHGLLNARASPRVAPRKGVGRHEDRH